MRLPILFAAAAAALLLAAAAGATIVPQRSVAGVKLGDSQARVRALLGKPVKVTVEQDDILGNQRTYRYRGLRIGFDGNVASSKVLSIFVTGRAQRTARGVGVGSTRKQVRRGVRGVRCAVEFGLDHCWRGVFAPGRTVTDFRIGRSGRVTSVLLSRVVD